MFLLYLGEFVRHKGEGLLFLPYCYSFLQSVLSLPSFLSPARWHSRSPQIFAVPHCDRFSSSHSRWDVCFPACEGQRTFLLSQRPQKLQLLVVEAWILLEKKKLKQIIEIYRLCDHYWLSLGFKNLCQLYAVKSCKMLSLMANGMCQP